MNSNQLSNKHPLSIINQWYLALLSFFLVAFGQPAWIPVNGLLASAVGYAIFWRVLLAHPSKKKRFYLAAGWFCAVQLVQLSWFISHPFWYIYAVYFLLALAIGCQFGMIALFIRPEIFSYNNPLRSWLIFLPLGGLWSLFEWMRLFVFSGFSFNPAGIALAGNLYSLQAASLAGVFALSFWVMLVNLLALSAWIKKSYSSRIAWVIAASLPYIYGAAHLAYHENNAEKGTKFFSTMLVQTAFAPEEIDSVPKKTGMIPHVIGEWSQILNVTKKHFGKTVNLIVLPEFVVPFGTYSDVYPLIAVKKAFYTILGPESLSALPSLDYPFYSIQNTPAGPQIFVNNAYWTQAIANYFQADVIIGLEDAEDMANGVREYYSSAIFIHPQSIKNRTDFLAERYSKQVLVPMGEYIPFESCKKLAASYGVFGSFTCGSEAVVMNSNGTIFSPSICYEETFGNLIKEGRQKGAKLFVNLTSDAWFPNSKLPKQHLEHARLRTVENGIPLVRACNTGITAAIDSHGRDIAVLGGEHPENFEWTSDSILVDVPIVTYFTLYSRFGDALIVGLSMFCLLGFLFKPKSDKLK